jgi:SAM-dependent methyltransferase
MQQKRFLAIFAPGFESVIGSMLAESLPGLGRVEISSGMVLFDAPCALEDVASLAFLNNVFLVLREWHTNSSSPVAMVRSVTSSEIPEMILHDVLSIGAGSFRVRFSRENQFFSVDKKTMSDAERYISAQTGLGADRVTPDMEFWFIVRSEKYSCFAARITKKQSTEKYLERGELRPEIAQLLVSLARVSAADLVIVDPFAGHGAIPAQLAVDLAARGGPASTVVHASDIDPELVAAMQRRFGLGGVVQVRKCDALSLSYLADGSVDLVVTDPPWGFWDGDRYQGEQSIATLYRGMLAEFARILVPDGRAFVLTGAKREMEEAVLESPVFARCAGLPNFRTDVLVNGKKSAVFALSKKDVPDGKA